MTVSSTSPERLSRSPYRLFRLVAALILIELVLLGTLTRHRVLGNEVFLGAALFTVVLAYLLPRVLGSFRALVSGGGMVLALIVAAAAFDFDYALDSEYVLYGVFAFGSDYALDFGMMERWSHLFGLLACLLMLDLLNTGPLRRASTSGRAMRVRRLTIFAILSTSFLLAVFVMIDVTMDEEGMGIGILPLLVAYGLMLDLLIQFGVSLRRRCVLRRGAGVAVAALAVLATSVPAGLWYELRESPEPPSTRMSMALEVYATLNDYYPYWPERSFTPRELWGRHRGRLLEADRVCGNEKEICVSWLHGISQMLEDLEDGHSYLHIPHERSRPAVDVLPIEGRAVIAFVGDGSDAEDQGLSAGAVILSVDGVPVGEALANLPPAWTTAAAERTRAYIAHWRLLLGVPGSSVEIEIEQEGGPARTVVLQRTPLEEGEYVGDELEEEVDSALYAEILEDGIVNAWLSGFEGVYTVELFVELLEENPDAPGMVLDLRSNSGGCPELTNQILGHFWPAGQPVGTRCEWYLISSGEREKHCLERRTVPWEPTYSVPLAVLIDNGSFSAAEIAATALCDSGRARCFGSTTGGEVDWSTVWDLPGAEVHATSAYFLDASGKPLRGVGVEPHEHIEPTIEDVRLGRDPAREAALKWLRSQVPEEG